MNAKEKDINSYIEDIVTKTMDQIFSNPVSETTQANSLPYSTIAEYTSHTGKRYRITKSQKDRDLSREQAFSEFLTEQQKKS